MHGQVEKPISAVIPRISYCGEPPLSATLWSSWNLDPVLLAALGIAVIVGLNSPAIAHTKHGQNAWALGLFVLFVAFVSPLCALTNALFSARTVHHLLVIAVAAPLFAVAIACRKNGGASPTPALVSATAVLWFWHWPPAYSAALASSGVYWVMQATLLATAVWFWARVFQQKELLSALFSVLAAMVQMGLLGALLTFSVEPFYSEHIGYTGEFGLTALNDQRLAGLIMWVPAMLPYLVISALVACRSWHKLRPSA